MITTPAKQPIMQHISNLDTFSLRIKYPSIETQNGVILNMMLTINIGSVFSAKTRDEKLKTPAMLLIKMTLKCLMSLNIFFLEFVTVKIENRKLENILMKLKSIK